MLSTIFSLTTLWWVMVLLYVPACLGLIVIVLLQKGKGVGFGGAFGMGGGGDAIFGPRTSRSLPQKLTYTVGTLFMVLALLMSIISGKVNRGMAPTLEGGPEISSAELREDDIQRLLNPDAPALIQDDTTTEGEGDIDVSVTPSFEFNLPDPVTPESLMEEDAGDESQVEETPESGEEETTEDTPEVESSAEEEALDTIDAESAESAEEDAETDG